MYGWINGLKPAEKLSIFFFCIRKKHIIQTSPQISSLHSSTKKKQKTHIIALILVWISKEIKIKKDHYLSKGPGLKQQSQAILSSSRFCCTNRLLRFSFSKESAFHFSFSLSFTFFHFLSIQFLCFWSPFEIEGWILFLEVVFGYFPCDASLQLVCKIPTIHL